MGKILENYQQKHKWAKKASKIDGKGLEIGGNLEISQKVAKKMVKKQQKLMEKGKSGRNLEYC